jgi:hypothetical protein
MISNQVISLALKTSKVINICLDNGGTRRAEREAWQRCEAIIRGQVLAE